MTNWSGSLTFDDKIFGNRRYEQVFWVRSWLLSDADLCIYGYRYTFIYMPLSFLRLYYNVNLCMRRHIVWMWNICLKVSAISFRCVC